MSQSEGNGGHSLVSHVVTALVRHGWQMMGLEVPDPTGFHHDAKIRSPKGQGAFEVYLEAEAASDERAVARRHAQADLPILIFRSAVSDNLSEESEYFWGLVFDKRFTSFNCRLDFLARYLLGFHPDIFPVQRRREADALPDDVAKAVELQLSGQLTEAENLIRQWIAENPNDAVANEILIEIIRDFQRYEEAVMLCDDVISSFPPYIPFHYLRAEILTKMGERENAITSYRDSLDNFPEDSGLLSGLAALEDEEETSETAFRDDSRARDDAASFEPKLGFTKIANKMVNLVEEIARIKSGDSGTFTPAPNLKNRMAISIKRYISVLARMGRKVLVRTSRSERARMGRSRLARIGRSVLVRTVRRVLAWESQSSHPNKTNEVISHTGNPLITIGLFGPWGAGKSTLINALENEFNQRNYVTFFINPWKWDGKGDIHDFVRATVLEQASNGPLRRQAFALRMRIIFRHHGDKIVFGALFLTVLSVMVNLADFTNVGDSLKTVVGVPAGVIVAGWVWKHFGKAIFDFLRGFFVSKQSKHVGATGLASAFQDIAALREGSADERQPLVLFIDDLDRCTPERVAEFIESIHSLTAVGCVTFLACDEEFVSAALNARYQNIVDHHRDGEKFGERFLEKIIQIPFRMPAVEEDGIRELGLISGQFPEDEAVNVDGPPRDEPASGKATDEKSESTVNGTVDEVDTAFPVTPIKTRRLTQIIAELLEKVVEPLGLNVRQVKSLSNTLKLYLDIAECKTEAEARRIAAFLFADRVDSDWLDSLYFGQDIDDGPIGRHSVLPGRLKEMLGDAVSDDKKIQFDKLYRLAGRLPQISAKKPTDKD